MLPLRIVLVGGALLLMACPRGIAVRLQDPTRADDLRILVGDSGTDSERARSVSLISVHTCDGHRPRWIVERSVAGAASVVSSVRYGHEPSGWRSVHPPESLGTGCYSLSVVGENGVSGGLRFDVNSAGIATSR
jgi:hypothetical protein